MATPACISQEDALRLYNIVLNVANAADNVGDQPGANDLRHLAQRLITAHNKAQNCDKMLVDLPKLRSM